MNKFLTLISAATLASIAAQSSISGASSAVCAEFTPPFNNATCPKPGFGDSLTSAIGVNRVGATWSYQSNLTRSDAFQVRSAALLITSGGARVTVDGQATACPESVDANPDPNVRGPLTECKIGQVVTKVRIVYSKTP